MRLKAISPFIASVLLIGFTIASGIIVYYFLTTLPKVQTSQVSSQTSQVLSFTGATFDVKVRNCNLLNGLVLWLPIDEGSGNTAYDYSGYGNNGTLYSGSTICSNPPAAGCPTWVDGRFGKALSFDGVDDYVATTLSVSAPFTVALWVNYRTFPTTHYTNIISQGISAVDRAWHIGHHRLTPNQYRIVIYFTDGTSAYFTSNFRPNVDEWYHLTLIVEANRARLYVNGILDSNLTYSGKTVKSSGIIEIGRLVGGSEYFQGILDEVRIYNRALSEDEIKELYYNGLTNKFNITIGLLNFGYADLGKKFYCYCLFKEWNNFTTAFNFR
jgi:hypothetical protein